MRHGAKLMARPAGEVKGHCVSSSSHPEGSVVGTEPAPGQQDSSAALTTHLQKQLVFCYSLNRLDKEVAQCQPLVDLLFYLLKHKGSMSEKEELENRVTLDQGSKAWVRDRALCFLINS